MALYADISLDLFFDQDRATGYLSFTISNIETLVVWG